jgi:hypothetical protein
MVHAKVTDLHYRRNIFGIQTAHEIKLASRTKEIMNERTF